MTTFESVLRTGRRVLLGWLRNTLLFAPVLLFITYATWNGTPPTPERWVAAFELGALLAIKETLTLLVLRRPLNRLMLGANLFLVIGGALAWLQLWQAFAVFAYLQGSAVLAAMAVVGVVTTVASRGGFVGVAGAERAAVRRASLLLLAVAAGSFALAFGFRGDRWLGGTLPILVLALSMRWQASRLTASRSVAGTATMHAPTAGAAVAASTGAAA